MIFKKPHCRTPGYFYKFTSCLLLKKTKKTNPKPKPQHSTNLCLKICIFTNGQISLSFSKWLSWAIQRHHLHETDRINEEQGCFFFSSSYLLRPSGRENSHRTQSKELQPAVPAPRSTWLHSIRSLRHWIQDVCADILENSPHISSQPKPLAPWCGVIDMLVGRDLWWALAQTLSWNDTITNTRTGKP